MTATKAKKSAPRKKTRPTGDDALRKKLLDAALPHAAKEGFTDALLARAGKEAGIDKLTLARLFPEAGLSLIAEFSHTVDTEMEKRLAKFDLPARKVRERIALAVKTRLAVLEPHKDAARRAVATLTIPTHAALGAKLLYRSVDAMWHAAGDTATDFNFYTKRGILAGVYSSTLMRWFNDKTKGGKSTDEFLAARIENVMQFEKLKAGVKKGIAELPSLAEMWRGKKRPSG